MANDPTEDYEAAALSRAAHSDPEAPGWFVDYAIACYEAADPPGRTAQPLRR